MKLRGILGEILHTRDWGRNQGGDNPMILLAVAVFIVVLVGSSSRIAHRCKCDVLLQLDQRLSEDGWLDVSSGGLEHRAVPVLVEFADAEAEVVDDALVLLSPGVVVGGGLLDGDETRVLAKLGVDDPLLHRGVDFLEALVQGLIHLDEPALEQVLLVGELLLDGGLLDGVHGFNRHVVAGVVESY
jgi:hypothetical protein